MEAHLPDSVFEAACRRLFDLHENGYKRPRPNLRRTATTATTSPDRRRLVAARGRALV